MPFQVVKSDPLSDEGKKVLAELRSLGSWQANIEGHSYWVRVELIWPDLHGAAPPNSTMGANGNYYLDTSTGNLFLKSMDEWAIYRRMGFPWITLDRKAEFAGVQEPDPSTVRDGSFFFDTNSGETLVKHKGRWQFYRQLPWPGVIGRQVYLHRLGTKLEKDQEGLTLERPGLWRIIYEEIIIG